MSVRGSEEEILFNSSDISNLREAKKCKHNCHCWYLTARPEEFLLIVSCIQMLQQNHFPPPPPPPPTPPPPVHMNPCHLQHVTFKDESERGARLSTLQLYRRRTLTDPNTLSAVPKASLTPSMSMNGCQFRQHTRSLNQPFVPSSKLGVMKL